MPSKPFASLGIISFMTMFDLGQECGLCGHSVLARSDTS